MKRGTFLIVLGISANLYSEAIKTPQFPLIVRPGDLFSAYYVNEIAADIQYKDKTVLIDGGVSTIEREDGIALIEVVSATNYRWEGNNLKMDTESRPVFCLFDKDNEGQIARLRRNQHVQVAGICAGKIVVGQTTFGAPDQLGKSIWKVVVIHCKVFQQFLPAVMPPKQSNAFYINRGARPPVRGIILDSTVYVKRGTHVFHRENCRRVDWRYQVDSVYRSQAIRGGHVPCAFCNP